jgi:hypothetical protein
MVADTINDPTLNPDTGLRIAELVRMAIIPLILAWIFDKILRNQKDKAGE